jgi:protein-S-isoprenylcysteine O-methyltransferase Ste14
MLLFYGGIVVFMLLSVFTVLRVRAEYKSPGTLSTPTVVIVWVLYFFHAGMTAFAAWHSLWPLPVSNILAMLIGSFLIVIGVTFFTAAILEFRSFQRMSGQKNNELVTSGVYRWSRNPQNVGWMMTLLGVALLGKSAGALLLVLLFSLLLHIYIVYVEEGFLESVYGEAYRQYRDSTARYLGIPRQRGKEAKGQDYSEDSSL